MPGRILTLLLSSFENLALYKEMWLGFKLARCKIMVVNLDFKLDWTQNQLRDAPVGRTVRLFFVMTK